MTKRLKVLIIILVAVVLIAIGFTVYLCKTGYFSSSASTPSNCPTGCPDRGTIDATVKYNGQVYTKYPVRVFATTTDCNGPNVAGALICGKNLPTSAGKCSVEICKGVKDWAVYKVWGKYVIPNTGIYFITDIQTAINYGGTNYVELNGGCKKGSDNSAVACP